MLFVDFMSLLYLPVGFAGHLFLVEPGVCVLTLVTVCCFYVDLLSVFLPAFFFLAALVLAVHSPSLCSQFRGLDLESSCRQESN